MPITPVVLSCDLAVRILFLLAKRNPNAVDASMRKIIEYAIEYKALPSYTDMEKVLGKLVVYDEETAKKETQWCLGATTKK